MGNELMSGKVGELSQMVIRALSLNLKDGQSIFIGEMNINHMREKHPIDFARYANALPQILATPDYVGLNPKDGSIEFVREFQLDDEYVKVAVRVSGGGELFARSLYVLNKRRVENFIAQGKLKKM